MSDDGPALARPHGKRKRPPGRWILRISFTLFFLLLVAAAAARATFTLIPPHAASPPSAVLSAEKRSQIDGALEIDRPLDRDQAIEFALDFTGQSLSFSPGHATSLEFGAAPRKANGTEYAALFVAVFNVAARKAGSTARAWRVHSDVRVFDKRIPMPLLADHDWVLVRDPADGARIYLDPLLSDLWLGATLSRNVKGGADIALPESI